MQVAPLAALLNVRDSVSQAIKSGVFPTTLHEKIDRLDLDLPAGARSKADYLQLSSNADSLVRQLLPGANIEVRSIGLVRRGRKISVISGPAKGVVTSYDGEAPEGALKVLALLEALILKARAEHAETFDPSVLGSTNADTSGVRAVRSSAVAGDLNEAVREKSGDENESRRTRSTSGSLRPVGFKRPGMVGEARSTTSPISGPSRAPAHALSGPRRGVPAR